MTERLINQHDIEFICEQIGGEDSFLQTYFDKLPKSELTNCITSLESEVAKLKGEKNKLLEVLDRLEWDAQAAQLDPHDPEVVTKLAQTRASSRALITDFRGTE